jgi:hypothetical protein
MLDQNIIEVESKWGQLVVTNAKSILLRNKKIATGALYESVRYQVNPNTGTIKFIFAEEGKWVQSGRRRGARFPPPGPILKWIKAKGIKGRDKKTGRFITDKSLTYLISRGISRNGITPLPFMSMAIKESREQLKKQLKQAVTKATVARLKRAAKAAFSKT